MPRRAASATLAAPRCALVVGGSGGIGAAVVRSLAEAGCSTIVFTYRSAATTATRLVEGLSTDDILVVPVQVDIADEREWDACLTGLVARFEFDLLVNAAGIKVDEFAIDASPASFRRQYQTNVFAPWLAMRTLGREMAANRNGRIVNITSIAADMNAPGRSIYGSTKSALEALTRSFAVELGRFDIRVNAVSPGFVDTDMIEDFDQATRDAVVSQVPLGRLATAADVAAAVRFLVAPEASYLHGSVVRVDGGDGSMNQTVSVIVPTHNKWSRLRIVLDAYSVHDFEDFEVVVCDDGSTDGTASGLAALDAPFPVTVVHGTHAGAAAARNRAAASAVGDVLVFADDDMVPAPGFLAAHAGVLAVADVLARGERWTLPLDRVGTHLDVPVDGGLLERLWAEARLTRAEQWAFTALASDPRHHFRFLQACTSNLAIRRSSFDRIGGFHEGFGRGWGAEDTEFGYRAQEYGISVVPVRSAKNLHLEHSADSGAKFRAGVDNFERFRDLYPGRRDVAALVDYLRLAIDHGHAASLFDEQSFVEGAPPVIRYPSRTRQEISA